jgi:hypothetical protein
MKIILMIILISILGYKSIAQNFIGLDSLQIKGEIDCLDSAVKINDVFYFGKISERMNAMLNKDNQKGALSHFTAFSNKLMSYARSLDSLQENPGICLKKIVDTLYKNEFKNYILAVKLLELESRSVPDKNSALPYLNYRNAFYNLLRAKSQFQSSLNEQLGWLQTKAASMELSKSLKEASELIALVKVGVDITEERTGIMQPKMKEVKTNSEEMKETLATTFDSYYKLDATGRKKVDSRNTDKINSGINTVLYDARRNNWWRAALGGVAGGLVAGLVIGIMK